MQISIGQKLPSAPLTMLVELLLTPVQTTAGANKSTEP